MRVAVIAGPRRVDLALPARRPLGEFLRQVVDLVEPAASAPAGWQLHRVGGIILDHDETLVAAGVVDGDALVLAPALAAPDGQAVDDVPAAVAAATSPAASDRAHRRVAHALAVAALAGAASSLTSGVASGVIAGILAVAALALGVALRHVGQNVEASIWAFGALVPAALAGLAIGRGSSMSAWWAPGVEAAAVAAVLAAFVVPARRSVLVPLAAGLSAAGLWCVVVAAGVTAPEIIGAPVVLAGLLLVDVAPRLAFHVLRVARLHDGAPTRRVVEARVALARLLIAAANVAGAVLAVMGAIALAADDDPWGWALAGLAAVLLALHSRRHDALGESTPLITAAVAIAVLLSAVTLRIEAGGALATTAAVALAASLAGLGLRAPRLRPLTRRRLDRAELLGAVPLLALVVVSSGLAGVLADAGRGLT